jgi:DNA-binding NtrC family response regulator
MPNDTISSLIERLPSPTSLEIRRQLDRAAHHGLSVLLHGETGTGKDVWAAYLQSLTDKGAFVSLHCADFPDSLLESQWFGYKKGAFTGATADHPGLWSSAQNGTLYLNRIDLLKPEIQSKLLRVIERRRYFPLGSNEEVGFTTRFIFSADDDLLHQVEAGLFRADLYYRISAFSIRIPPLRERKEDIQPLFQHFATRTGLKTALSGRGVETLLHHPWPGNIREMENLVTRCAVSEEKLDDLTLLRQLGQSAFLTTVKAQEPTLMEMEKRYIHHLLNRYHSKTKVAEILGVTRKTLYNKLHLYGKD